jgi:hypothetical protein
MDAPLALVSLTGHRFPRFWRRYPVRRAEMGRVGQGSGPLFDGLETWGRLAQALISKILIRDRWVPHPAHVGGVGSDSVGTTVPLGEHSHPGESTVRPPPT